MQRNSNKNKVKKIELVPSPSHDALMPSLLSSSFIGANAKRYWCSTSSHWWWRRQAKTAYLLVCQSSEWVQEERESEMKNGKKSSKHRHWRQPQREIHSQLCWLHGMCVYMVMMCTCRFLNILFFCAHLKLRKKILIFGMNTKVIFSLSSIRAKQKIVQYTNEILTLKSWKPLFMMISFFCIIL